MMSTVGGLNSLRPHQEVRGPPETSAALVLGDLWAPTGAAKLFGAGTTIMTDNARQTGPALEAHRQFLLWLVPTVE